MEKLGDIYYDNRDRLEYYITHTNDEICKRIVTLKRMGNQLDSLWFFQKCVFQREGEVLVFCDFNVIVSHNFP